MPTTNSENIEAIKVEILSALGYDSKNPPANLDEKQAAAALGVQTSTLCVWRSTGRYNLPFIKAGRLVRYRVSDLADFMARRTSCQTGGAK